MSVNRHFRILLLLLFCPPLSACDDEKPYTPFQIATALPRDDNAPSKPKREKNEVNETERGPVSLRAGSNQVSWQVFDRRLQAPDGTVFDVAIPSPESTEDEIAVWVLPKKEQGIFANAGLWLFNKRGEIKARLLDLPDFLPTGKDCHYRATLEKTGATSLTSRVVAQCTERLLPGSPSGSLAVVAPGRTQTLLIHLRLQEPAPGESIQYQVNSLDRDDDQRDDIQIDITLRSPNGSKETLPFRWLSRTAGASRQGDAPRAQLSKRASRLSTAASRRAERARVPAQVDTLRRLVSAICSETGTQKFDVAGGTPLPCGDIQTTMIRLTHAATQAHLGEGHWDDALGEVERVSWFAKKPTEKQKQSLKQLLFAKVPHQPSKRLARFDVKTPSSSGPYGSPLRFSDDGQLWALTQDGMTKRLTMKGDPPLIVAATDESPEKRIEPPVFLLHPTSTSKRKLHAALPSCARSEVQLVFVKGEQLPAAPVPIAILAPRPGACRTFSPTALQAIPHYWEGSQLVLTLGGQLVNSGTKLRSHSAPLAWGTSLGVAIKKGNRLNLFTGDVAEGLHHCVAENKGEKVACLKGESIIVLGPKN